MDVSTRKWWIKIDGEEKGPIPEDEFQKRLRAGEFPLNIVIRSNLMDGWQPLLSIVATDDTFRRPSTMPPPESMPGSGE